MREIKFRAWNPQSKEMHLPNEYNLLYRWFIPSKECTEYWESASAFKPVPIILMQYTGLKDKNGKEIFEGDIVENMNGDNRQILYTHNSFEMRLLNGNREKSGTIWWHSVEIIGNIHENKELLDS